MSAPGLRVVPASDLSSIDHADLWLDPDSGVPLRVEVYAAGTGTAAFTSEFREFSSDRPDSARVGFEPPAGVDVEFDDVLDIADAANQYAPGAPARHGGRAPEGGGRRTALSVSTAPG